MTYPVFSVQNSLSDVFYSKFVLFLSKTYSIEQNTFKRLRFVYYIPCTHLQNFVNGSPLLDIEIYLVEFRFNFFCFSVISRDCFQIRILTNLIIC